MKALRLEKLTSLFKSLADSNRLKLLQQVCSCQSCTVQEAASCCDIDMSVVSRHLSQLKEAGVLSAEKEGKKVHYSLNGKELVKTLRELADYIENSNCC